MEGHPQPRTLIRLFRAEDLDRIMEIERATFSREAYTRKMFLELQRDCGALFFVAQRGRRVAGYIVLCRNSNKAELVSIAVDPKLRKLGIGTALIEHAFSELVSRKVRCIELMVRVTNEEAVHFYRSFEFRRVRRVRRYYEDGADAYRMRKIVGETKQPGRQRD
jgi:ribosomal-protein-alanine N-acetyltransferase